MKAIIIGASLSGKTSLVQYLRSRKISVSEMDEELVKMNDGRYPEDNKYKHDVLAPRIVEQVLQNNILFFTNTDYFSDKDISVARSRGFSILQLKIDLEELKKRNSARIQQGYDDHSGWLLHMLQYQKEIKEKNLVDKEIDASQPVEKIAEEILSDSPS